MFASFYIDLLYKVKLHIKILIFKTKLKKLYFIANIENLHYKGK